MNLKAIQKLLWKLFPFLFPKPASEIIGWERQVIREAKVLSYDLTVAGPLWALNEVRQKIVDMAWDIIVDEVIQAESPIDGSIEEEMTMRWNADDYSYEEVVAYLIAPFTSSDVFLVDINKTIQDEVVSFKPIFKDNVGES